MYLPIIVNTPNIKQPTRKFPIQFTEETTGRRKNALILTKNAKDPRYALAGTLFGSIQKPR